MIRVIPRWKVTVELETSSLVFWMHNDHMGNVLRQVSDMQFTENGLVSPKSIKVEGAQAGLGTYISAQVGVAYPER